MVSLYIYRAFVYSQLFPIKIAVGPNILTPSIHSEKEDLRELKQEEFKIMTTDTTI